MQDFTSVDLATAYNIVGMNYVPQQENAQQFNECDKETQINRVLLSACALLRSPSMDSLTRGNVTVKCGRLNGDPRGCGAIIEASGIHFRAIT